VEIDGVLITVPAGFETDYASVPRLPLMWLIAGDVAHEAAVLHDFLYRIHSLPDVDRKQADECFLALMECIEEPPSDITRHMMYWMVRACGSGSFHKLKVGDSLCA